MKNILLTLLLVLNLTCFSQAISVNTSTYTVPQLVNSVLINSPCVSGTNISWRTGTNFGSSNGIGYFENSNPNFPISSGVILSTGNVASAPGPNNTMLNDGSNSWTGDSDLETTLANSGITMVSKNASVLEFDFTPISSNFSFDFVFASEEYGNFQCQFSDAFAFLLTNTSTGVTTNLAVVPGSSLPISVVTIRDFLYNSSCPSVNPSFFGSFNGGSQAAGSATNFNGQTVLMSASSALVPNVPYHIKLVVADRNDSLSDSAIFLSSTSFNIGQDVLGADRTIANNTAICFGQNYTINSGLSSATYTFSWTKDGNTLPGEVGSSLTINQAGIYGITYTRIVNPCQPITDTINIEYYPEIVIVSPSDLYKCNSGSGSYSYNITLNTPVVMTGQNANTQVAYFANQSDANNNANPLSSPYNSAGNETIFVRVTNPNTTCFTVKSFQLLTAAPPVANMPQNMTACETTSGTGTAIFNFSTQTATVLNGQSNTINNVSYHTSSVNANAGVNPTDKYYYVGTSGTTIYVRVQNTSDTNCFSLTSFQLIVNPSPLADDLQDVIVCTDYTLPVLTNGNYFTETNGGGTALFAGNVITTSQTIFIFNQTAGTNSCKTETSFKVTIIDLNTLDPGDGTYCDTYTLPSPDYASYYTQTGGMGTQLFAGDVITSSQTVYLYYVSLLPPFCVAETDIVVTIFQSPAIPNYPNIFSCDNYVLPNLPVGKYFTGTNGSGVELPVGTVISSTQTVYVYAETNSTPKCTNQDSFTVYIGLDPVADITECVSYTLPVLPVGNYFTGPNGSGTALNAGDIITSTQALYVYAVSSTGSGCVNDVQFDITITLPFIIPIADQTSCGNYILPNISVGNYYTGSQGTGNMLNAGSIVYSSQTLYIYITNGSNCQNEKTFNVIINSLPQIDSRSSIDVCDNYTLSALNIGNYYTGPNGTGTLLNVGEVITTTQTIFIYAISATTPPCVAENNFTISIYNRQADAPADVIACDSYTLPALIHGDYYTATNGSFGTGTKLFSGQTISSSQTLFVFVEPPTRGVDCVDENSFTITINQTPVIPVINNVNACESYTLPSLTIGNYFTQTGGTGNSLVAGDIIMTDQTLYVYAETGTNPNCTAEKSFTISLFNVDELLDVNTCSGYILPNLTKGKYYTGPNGSGTILAAGSTVTISQTIYIYALSPFSNCSDETSFDVIIVAQPIANSVPIANRTICDTDETNDGIFVFDLTTLNSIILGSQTGPEFTINYYANLADANSNSNPITNTALQSVYVRVNNSLAPNCFDIKNIQIIVNKIPEPKPENGVICVDNITGSVINTYTIMSGLNSNSHSFVWTNSAGIVVGTNSNLTVSIPDIYSITATNSVTGCISLPTISQVIISQPAIVSYTTSEAFSENQNITISATGSGGNYEYQLDDSQFQDSNNFENVSFGNHIITVRDKNGCGITTIDALLVNYPKYFTPNGDGMNDYWNVIGLENQPNAKIQIFDRYGKFLKGFNPTELGWDGTYNGQQMPSTDYWFTVNFIEQGQTKEFKSHFAMKR